MLDHKYKVFYYLAKNPNTTKVAEELYLSQPAISKGIRELEKELGITLFHREKGRMYLTQAGKYLFAEIEPLLEKERKILFEIDRLKNTFTVHCISGPAQRSRNMYYPNSWPDSLPANPE